MNNQRSIPYIVILLVVVIGGYFLFFDRTSTPRADDLNVSENGETIPISRGELIDVDGSTYRFDSVKFIFSDAGVNREGVPLTTVRFQFQNFIRNGRAIEILPYRLGTHEGSCTEVTGILTSLTKDQNALGYARCFWNGAGKEFVVFQDGTEVVTQYRSIVEGKTSLQPLRPLLSIDVTSIVEE